MASKTLTDLRGYLEDRDRALFDGSFDEWLVNEGLRHEPKCRTCGLPSSGPPRISELPKEDDPSKSAAYVEQLCANGHVVKVAIMSWKLLETLQKMGEDHG